MCLVDDDSPDDEHGTAAVSSGLIYETQIQTDPQTRSCPAEAGHVLRVSRGASSRHRILRSSPLRT